jgi:hypothetical protein
MVLLSCSGTGGGTGSSMYAKLANGVAQYNCAQVSPTDNSSQFIRGYDLWRVVNKRSIAESLIELGISGCGWMMGNSEAGPMLCAGPRTSRLANGLLH